MPCGGSYNNIITVFLAVCKGNKRDGARGQGSPSSLNKKTRCKGRGESNVSLKIVFLNVHRFSTLDGERKVLEEYLWIKSCVNIE